MKNLKKKNLANLQSTEETEVQVQPENVVTVENDVTDEMEVKDYMSLIPKKALPLGVRDSLESMPEELYMPTLCCISPMIGALATGVKLDVHYEMKNLNLLSFIVGEPGSNKSMMDALPELWMHHMIAEDERLSRIEQEYLEQKERKKNAKEQPVDPKVPRRYQSARTSVSQLVTRLQNAQGKHLYTYSPEADVLAQTNKANWSNTGVVRRQAFDGTFFSTDYKDGKSTGLFVKSVLWNITLCGTPDALFRTITNYTDGEVSRWLIARMPDNTFAPLNILPPRSKEAEENIRQVALVLEELKGDLVLDKLEEASRTWVERVRQESLKEYDVIRAKLRVRVPKVAMRMTCCIMLCAYAESLIKKLDRRGSKPLPRWAGECETALDYVKHHHDDLLKKINKFQTPEIIQFFYVISDYIMDNLYFYFKDRMARAMESADYISDSKVPCRKNSNVFDTLPREFTYEDAKTAKGTDASSNSVKQMIKHWKKSGMIRCVERERYAKIG